MKLHTLAQMLDRLRRGKPKRAPKLEEVEIQAEHDKLSEERDGLEKLILFNWVFYIGINE